MDWTAPTQEASWQATLDLIAPPGGRLSWLKLVWVPGDRWEPVHRWCVYQMLPIDRAPSLVRDDLRGPSPRVRGRWDRVLGRFIPDPTCNVNLLQWQLYQDTHCYGRPYWIVQGTQGGHKKSFNRIESQVARMNGAPDQPPLIGDLPFASPDQRTFDKLLKLDLVRSYGMLLDRAAKNPAAIDEHDERLLEDMRGKVWKWLESQVQDAVRSEKSATRALQETARPTRFDEGKLETALFAE